MGAAALHFTFGLHSAILAISLFPYTVFLYSGMKLKKQMFDFRGSSVLHSLDSTLF